MLGRIDVEDRAARLERRTQGPLAVAAVAFVAVYAWPILQPGLSPGARQACAVVGWVIWALFGVDYTARLALSGDRRRFVRANLLDLAVVVLPVLRPLRALRLVTMVGVLNRRAAASLRGRVAVYVVGATGLVVFLAALAVLDAERANPEANIDDFGDASWWALTTITTVGYGDRFPTTGQGRTVAVLLMLAGIALLGVVTASLASWLLDRVRDLEEAAQAATRADIDALTRQVEALRDELAAARGGSAPKVP